MWRVGGEPVDDDPRESVGRPEVVQDCRRRDLRAARDGLQAGRADAGLAVAGEGGIQDPFPGLRGLLGSH